MADALELRAARPLHLAHHKGGGAHLTEADGSPTWLTGGEYFVVALTTAGAGVTLQREADDEYLLILPPDASAQVQWQGESIEAVGDSVTIIPPGGSGITLPRGGQVMRVFSTRETDLAASAGNAADYAAASPFPASPGSEFPLRLRTFALAGIYDPHGPLIQSRIVRTRHLMVNVFAPFTARRPLTELRPHWHDDFDQASVVTRGRWMHHIRTPWTDNYHSWAEDQHLAADTPSVIIIPPTLTHTSRNLDDDACLVDVFAPPRQDFLDSGLVLNADEYATRGQLVP